MLLPRLRPRGDGRAPGECTALYLTACPLPDLDLPPAPFSYLPPPAARLPALSCLPAFLPTTYRPPAHPLANRLAVATLHAHQTREYFHAKDGYIVDNPSVGPTLRDAYWRPGNSEPFLGLVEGLTGKPLSGDAWVRMLKQDVQSLLAEEKVAYEAMAKKLAAETPSDDVDLNMRIKIVDGDEVIADTAADGGFLKTCKKFEKYIQTRFKTTE